MGGFGLLADACESFRTRCAEGILPDRAVIARHVESLALPHLAPLGQIAPLQDRSVE